MGRKILNIALIAYSIIVTMFFVLIVKQNFELQDEHQHWEWLIKDFHYKDSIFIENYHLQSYIRMLDKFYLIGKSKKEIENIFSIDSISFLQEINKNDKTFENIVEKQYQKVSPSNYNSIMLLQGFYYYFLFYNDTLYRRIDDSGYDGDADINYYIKERELISRE